MGDRHVYGAKSRFLTDAVMSTLEPFVWPDTVQSEAELPQPGAPRIDVASKLRGLWT